MTCKLTFLPVGNADSIVICPDDDSTVVIDIANPRVLDKWLQNNHQNNIRQVYITHAHRDHFPQLVKLVEFLKIWIKRGTVERFILPHSVYKDAVEKLDNKRGQTPHYQQLEVALNQLDDWDRKNIIRILPGSLDSNQFSHGQLNINILHPSLPFIEKHLAKTSGRLNEISLVLRVTYGDFAALLLADIEGDGLRKCVDSSMLNPPEFSANIVKIPHHGAWPKNGDDLKQLLETIDAEIAFLSVGSENTYGHVVPDLFDLLLSLKNDTSKRLQNFACTEVTRTCVHSARERSSMGKSGLAKKQLCAGEITIFAETSGQWQLKTQTVHEDIISSLTHPACKGKADLGIIPT